ncbi:MAG: Tungstate uptake system permease protein TupB [Alphaproteobacteria bacterium MarineAlpha5_Bin5]|nr:MAG: Tungstate uptake system permease protein TupB [Alphaproteobacteria bacterium MarineAlpha5_Bin5]PPR52559.1 MAG: Tungstate uptake system permease protein TupB [Alphaproteobacteria bacterium MarineAlpha5_Bin4]|tara:strand:- start:7176 stop:7868 length:693 start_codon:yes stop_codon:yes gene_type:complete
MNILEIFTKSLFLIITFNKDLWEIIILSLYVSFVALIIASIAGILSGYFLALKNIFFKNIILVILNSLMGIPPVVVGLIVYFLFASGGPLGIMQLLYTPTAMIIAQIIIIFPIVASISHEIFAKIWIDYKDQFRSLNMPFFGTARILIKHSYFLIVTALLSAYGRAISEVGAVMIVGGNIDHYTRVMTTAISLETRMGNLEYAMALGLVLISLTILIYSLIYILTKRNFK